MIWWVYIFCNCSSNTLYFDSVLHNEYKEISVCNNFVCCVKGKERISSIERQLTMEEDDDDNDKAKVINCI